MKRVFLGFSIVAILFVCGFTHAQDAINFKVIVNTSNAVATMSKAQTSKLFLKKKTKWENGSKVVPVDLAESSPVRVEFSKAIHGKSVSSIKSYWQKLIFSGRAVPPPIKASDPEVVNFVKANRGAIGYVSADASIADVKVLKIKD